MYQDGDSDNNITLKEESLQDLYKMINNTNAVQEMNTAQLNMNPEP